MYLWDLRLLREIRELRELRDGIGTITRQKVKGKSEEEKAAAYISGALLV